MRITLFAFLAVLLMHSAQTNKNDWSWQENDKKNVETRQFTQEDSQVAETSFPDQTIVNVTNIDEVVDSILTSTRQGRNLKEFDEVYTDPNVQDALQKGDDSETRNLIRSKLCSLGLMQCEDVQGKRPYIAPEDLVYAQPVAINPVGRPIPTIPLKGGPVRGGYGPPKPVPFPHGPPPPFKYGPKPHIPPRRQYGPPPKPYPSKPFLSGSSFSGSSFESSEFLSRPPHGSIESEFPYEIEHGASINTIKKPLEVIVNAQGGSEQSGVQQHVHHHYHHGGNEKVPAVVVNPIPLVSGAVSAGFAETNGFKPSSSLSFGGYKESNNFASTSNVADSFGTSVLTSGSIGNPRPINSGLFTSNPNYIGGSSFSGSGISGNYGGQSIASYGGSNGLGSFGSKPVAESFGPQTFGSTPSSLYSNSIGASVGYYGNSNFYKKELNVNGLQSNSLQSGYGDKFQAFESARNENYDCVCVPYDQCPSHEIIGRKDDLVLALDPRNLKSDIEAEDERVITDGNGTMAIIRVTKDAPSKQDEEKKKVKRETAAENKDGKTQAEGRQSYGGGFGRPPTCGPRHVCCRRPLRPNIPTPSAVRQCGTRHSQGINGRIKNPVYVDGDSEFGEYPWQVAILKKDPKESVYVCGGTLIDQLHIITAAHCVKTYTNFDLRVRLGEWDVNHDVEFYPYIERDVSRVDVHPEFYAGTLYNDIAILRLEKPVDWSRHPHISPACLPSPHEDYTGARCWTTGWGKDAFGDFGKYQNILKEVDVPIIGHGHCQRQLQQTRLGYDFNLHPGFVCAGGEEGKDACKGDGGGPMVCERGGSWKVVGVVSWGIGCGQVGVPGVYVKVAHYLDWIRQVTQRY